MSSDIQKPPVPSFARRFIENSRERARRAEAAAPEIAAATAAIREDAMRRKAEGRLAHLKACGVDGETLKAFAGPGLKSTPALLGVREWLDGDKSFCVLSGHVGAGKSVAAAYSLLRAVRLVRTMAHPLADGPVEFEEWNSDAGLFLTAARLRFAERWTEGKGVPLFDRAATVRWLALDELREEDTKGAGRERLEEVLSERYAMGRRTCITTNLGQRDMARVLGERLASRLAEGAVVVDPGDTDLRRGGA